LLEWRKYSCDINKQSPSNYVHTIPYELAHDLEVTKNSIVALYQEFSKRNLKLIPRVLSQNCVETYFSEIRGQGGYNVTPLDYTHRNGLILFLGIKNGIASKRHTSYECESFTPLTMQELRAVGKELAKERHLWFLSENDRDASAGTSQTLEEIRRLSSQELQKEMQKDQVRQNPKYFFTWRNSATNAYTINYIAGAILRSCLRIHHLNQGCIQLLTELAVEDPRTYLLRVCPQLSALARVICSRFYSVATPRNLQRLQHSLLDAALKVTTDETVLQFWIQICLQMIQKREETEKLNLSEEELRRLGHIYITKFTKALIGDFLSQHNLSKVNTLAFRKRVEYEQEHDSCEYGLFAECDDVE